MRMRASTKIALGFFAIVAVALVGYRVVSDRMIMGETFDPVGPGQVNIVGINPGAGYKIVVANQVAQLVEASGGFGGGGSDAGGATEGAIKRRVPIRELLATLGGDSEAAGRFVSILNEMHRAEDWPTIEVVWPAEKLRRALDGDPVLERELVQDLNMNLDGTPLPELRISALENGIVLEYPVELTVSEGGARVVGNVREAYRPRLILAVEKQYEQKPDVTHEMRAGYYEQEAQAVIDNPAMRENVRQTLERKLSAEHARRLAEGPEHLLRNATIVVNESHISSARYTTYDTVKGKMHDLTLDLTDEGRRRLWQYSKRRVGNQLLLTADGVAIAAPRIGHELAQRSLRVTQLEDEVLLRGAVEMLKEGGARQAVRR